MARKTNAGKAAAGTAAADRYCITPRALKMTASEAARNVKGVASIADALDAVLLREKAGSLEFRITVDVFFGIDLVRLSSQIQAAVRKSVEQFCSSPVSSVSVAVSQVLPALPAVRKKRK